MAGKGEWSCARERILASCVLAKLKNPQKRKVFESLGLNNLEEKTKFDDTTKLSNRD